MGKFIKRRTGMKHIVVMVALIILGVSCKASILSSSLGRFDYANSIIRRSLSSMYHIHNHSIYDPLSKEDKTHMNRFNRFMKNGFAPDFDQKHITAFHQRYKINELLDKRILELVKKPYFKKELPNPLHSVIDMFDESCPEFPNSLELPVDRSFFVKKDSHPNLTKEQLSRCGYFLTDISNIYSYACRNNVPILYALEKAALLERFLVVFFTQFNLQCDFQIEQDTNESLNELSRGMRGIILPHYYTHPSDPYSFYVHQVAGLIFVELEKYRK